MRIVLLAAALAAAAHAATAQTPDTAMWVRVGATLGALPTYEAGSIRFNRPRSDLAIRMADVTFAPSLALTSWASFAPEVDTSWMVMGDLVVTTEELVRVEQSLAAEGLNITAVHNHLAGETPAVLYLHYHGHGAAEALATSLARAPGQTGAPRQGAAGLLVTVSIDTGSIHRMLGVPVRGSGKVGSVTAMLLGDPVRAAGNRIPPSLGLGSPINFQEVTIERWVTTGDFAVTAERVQPLVRALVGGGITVTAVHSHLVGEEPAIYFLHFWGDGSPDALLRALHDALEAARTTARG